MDHRFKLIYADVPWHFKVHSSKGEGRSALQHYPVMSLKDVIDLPVQSIAEKDSVLLMWVIDPMIEQGYQVMRAWGYTPKTVGFYWAKTNKYALPTIVSDYLKLERMFFAGLGYYTRANVEQCILGTRGKGLAVRDHGVRRLIVAPRGRHSEKPIQAYEGIERLFGDVSRVELFARRRRDGWSAFGNQVKGSISLPDHSKTSGGD